MLFHDLLIIHDVEDDPATERQTTLEDVRLVAAGMEAARHDRLVWTDDYFHHPPDWLATLSAGYEEYGPVSEVPYFVGRNPLSVLLEPLYASAGSLGPVERSSGVAGDTAGVGSLI